MLTLSKEGEKLDIKLLEQVKGGAAGFCGKNLCHDNGCGTNNYVDVNYSMDYKIWWASVYEQP